MGIFDSHMQYDDVEIASRINEGKLYKTIQFIAISIFLVAAALIVLEICQLIELGYTANGIILTVGAIGGGGFTALPWIRVFERINDKRFKITAIVFMALLGACVILWIICGWQIIGLIQSGIENSEGEVLDGLVNSLNTIKFSLIVSLQFVIVSDIAMKIIKYRKTLLPYQIMSALAFAYIDFFCTLLLTSVTITKEGFELSESATLLTNTWTYALLVIACLLSIFPNIVFRRTDRRRLITTANEALENSNKPDKFGKTERHRETGSNDSVEEKLRKIQNLLNSGIITQEEYEQKRKDILDDI